MTKEQQVAIDAMREAWPPDVVERMLRAQNPEFEVAVVAFAHLMNGWAANEFARGERNAMITVPRDVGLAVRRLADAIVSPTEKPNAPSTPQPLAGTCARCHGDGYSECRCSPHEGMPQALPTRP